MININETITLRNLLRSKNSVVKEQNGEKGNTECGKCALRGNVGIYKNNMVVRKMYYKKCKTKQSLGKDCKDYGIYGAICIKCNKIHIGKTVNSFSKRWNIHRNIWKINISIIIYQLKGLYAALIIHYKKMHKKENPDNLTTTYKVQFLEKTEKINLIYSEQWWLQKH